MTPGMPTFPMPAVPVIPTTPMSPAAPTSPTAPVPNPLLPNLPTSPAPAAPMTPAAPTMPAAPAMPPAQVSPIAPPFPPAPPETEQSFQLNPLLPRILPTSPNITVPANPLLPQSYSTVLDYESLQYLNGYLRTQIGKYVEAQFLFGSSNTTTRFGKLIGVGLNYILIEDVITGDVVACDFYNMKFVRTYARELLLNR